MRHYLIFMVILGGLGTPLTRADDDKPSAAKTVKQFVASMAAFPYYQCRYVLSSDTGLVDENTHTVVWKSKATVECRYAVDGEYEAFEQFGNDRPDPSKIPPSAKKGDIHFIKTEGFAGEKLIRGPDGDGKWMDVMSNMMLGTRDRRGYEVAVFTPLDFGFEHRRSLGPEVMLERTNYYTVSDLGWRQIGDRRCVGHRFEAAADQLVISIWFDPKWGMMPVWQEFVQQTGGNTYTSRHVVTSAKLLSKNRWFPERLVRYSPGKQQGVFEYILKEVDADKRPTRDDLSVVLPVKTTIFDQYNNKWFNLRQDEKLSGYDIPELFEKTAQSEKGKPMDTAIEHRSSNRALWFWLSGGLGLLLVLIGGFRWLRSRRTAGRASGSP